MDVRFVARNVELQNSVKDLMEKKLGKLERFFDRILDTQVAVDFKRGMYVVEITSNINGMVMRGEDYAPDLRKAFEKSLKNIERQVKRHKDMLVDRLQLKTKDISFELETEPFVAEEEKQEGGVNIVKVKRFPVRVMTPEEAALQMDLLGHSFFLFRDGDTGDLNVVYRRKEGGYGVLKPE
ncbi:sigma 54 modulation protein/ribosomal protein S30EA [Thermanaerovibrio acidaminovorans DSM 6589]|uniref:Ribosome hibernation promoting factor n=1 Tax=Thermanaerovibrio acidaminovorans (strain ATCC 49978 / DSM 6589 / Su883) TaxID=525903 RepID=D1B9M7_THEAS|nr:ribosome-associated translation inhibitor RaiA [Thermanaerovibrio acidaminovorans]ACZ18980.1 sigma 54 modulation protein/ribosomal protein S30EA [Thermanaerovibrio acidaminovorans DSM 6589]